MKKPKRNSTADLWLLAAHDFRQPMQSLALLSSILSRDTDLAHRQEASQRMSLVLEAFESMIRCMTELARIEAADGAGLETQNRATFLVATEIDETVAECLSGSDCAVRTDHGQHDPLVSRGDARTFKMMVKGMLLFAIKSGGGGEIIVKSGMRSRRPVCDVVYSGASPAKAIEKQAFTEVWSDHDAPRLRLGLGLASVKHLALLLGAQLSYAKLRANGSGESYRLTLQMPQTMTRSKNA